MWAVHSQKVIESSIFSHINITTTLEVLLDGTPSEGL